MTDSGVVIVDKPAEWTSHDVVGRVRRLAGTRKVGHAGTLDPMATGVLVLGVGKGTKLLGHLTLTEKVYQATIRLGERTNTDDAEGEVVAEAAAGDVSDAMINAGVQSLTGAIEQIPPQVSAVKVDGKRAYKQARAGKRVELDARPVTVHRFDVSRIRRGVGPHGDRVDIDASVGCSSGTYIRSLARDLGERLGVGGHLTALRRTRVGPYTIADSATLERLAESFSAVSLERAVAAAFPTRTLTPAEARKAAHGNRVSVADLGTGPIGLYDPEGAVIALGEEKPGFTQPIVVFGG